jgi:hypothetical protein
MHCRRALVEDPADSKYTRRGRVTAKPEIAKKWGYFLFDDSPGTRNLT